MIEPKEKEDSFSFIGKGEDYKEPLYKRVGANIPSENRKRLYIPSRLHNGILGVLTFCVSYYILLLIGTSFITMFSKFAKLTSKNPVDMIQRTFDESIILGLILILLAFIISKLAVSIKGRNDNKDMLGRKISDQATGLDAGFMTNEEMREVFNITSYDKPDGIVIAKHRTTGEAISIPWESKSWLHELNRHSIVFGASGTGKTASIILPTIYQNFVKGNSLVVIDAKGGELYKKTSAAAKYLGYNTRVFNITGDGFEHSDGWDCLKTIRESPSPQNAADIFTSIVFANTSGAKDNDDYWYKSELNLFKAIILYVAWSDYFNPHGGNERRVPNSSGSYRTMDVVYELICDKQALESELKAAIEATDTAHQTNYLKQPFQVWVSNEKKEQVRTGLATRLGILQNKKVTRVLSEDEIDFLELDKEKTIFYIEVNDKHYTYQFMLSLFINFLCNTILDYADRLSSSEGLKRPLYFILDEFKATGKLPEWGNKLSVARSRNIGFMMCMQSLGQLKDLYGYAVGGKFEWEEIADNCDIRICLGSNDKTTVDWLSEKGGETTIDVESTSKNYSTVLPMQYPLEKRVQTSSKTVPVLPPDKIRKLTKEQILIITSSHDVTIQGRYFYEDHPLFNVKYVNSQNGIVKRSPISHVPEWQIIEKYRSYCQECENSDTSSCSFEEFKQSFNDNEGFTLQYITKEQEKNFETIDESNYDEENSDNDDNHSGYQNGNNSSSNYSRFINTSNNSEVFEQAEELFAKPKNQLNPYDKCMDAVTSDEKYAKNTTRENPSDNSYDNTQELTQEIAQDNEIEESSSNKSDDYNVQPVYDDSGWDEDDDEFML